MKKKRILLLILVFALLSTFCFIGCREKGTVTVTFKQEGEVDIVKTVNFGESLDAEEIPTPKQIEGFEVVWDVTDFSNITEDLIVNAVVSPLYLTVTFVQDGYDDIVKQVRWWEDLTDIPTPRQEDGYTVSWRVSDFRRIK